MDNNQELIQTTGELTLDSDSIIMMAEVVEKRVAGINTIMRAALKMTTHLDWVLIGGIPYLQETGSSKIASLLNVSWQIKPPEKIREEDGSGHYSYRTSGKFFFSGRSTEAMGLRSTRDEFFIGSAKDKDGNPKPQKKPQDVDERDVMQAAYTNCLNNGIKRTVPGLRNITVEQLAEGGIDVGKVKGYGFNNGAPKEMSGEAVNQKAEIERMLREMCGDDKWKDGLKKITSFTPTGGGEPFKGYTDINKLSEKNVGVTLHSPT